MDEQEQPMATEAKRRGLHPTTDEGPANPSDEAEDRNKSPEGGRSFNTDEVAIDPDNAPSANFFIMQVTVAMFVVVVLLVLAAITGSGILTAVALLAIVVGLGTVLFSIFRMMATD